MTFSRLLNSHLNSQTCFITAISSCLPREDQLSLSRVSKGAKLLVDATNSADFNRLKLTSIFENCQEQIEHLSGPWRAGQEVNDRIQAAMPILNQELQDCCQSLRIRNAKGDKFVFEEKPLSMMEKVKIAGLVDQKKAENLLCFFKHLAIQIPLAHDFEKTLIEYKTPTEKAQQIRSWMQENRGLLAKIKNVSEIGGLELYFTDSYTSMPSEVLWLDGLEQNDFYFIVRNSLLINCPCLIRNIVKMPRLFEMPLKWIGKLLEHAARGGALDFIINLMNGEKFQEIPDEFIRNSFEIASQVKNLKVIQAFLTNSRVCVIPNLNIGQAILAGVEHRSLFLIETLIKDSRFDLIEVDCLSRAIFVAVCAVESKIAKALLKTRRACSIPYENLQETFHTAYSREILDDLEVFFKSYEKELVASSLKLSLAVNLSELETETDHKMNFIQKVKSIFSEIKGDHDDIAIDSDSESDDESFKENIEAHHSGDKRTYGNSQIETPNAKRRKASSPSRI